MHSMLTTVGWCPPAFRDQYKITTDKQKKKKDSVSSIENFSREEHLSYLLQYASIRYDNLSVLLLLKM